MMIYRFPFLVRCNRGQLRKFDGACRAERVDPNVESVGYETGECTVRVAVAHEPAS